MFRVAIGLSSMILAINAIESPSHDFAIESAVYSGGKTDSEDKVFRPDIGQSRNVSIEPGVEKTNKSSEKTRLPLCCPYASRWTSNRCVQTNDTFHFPPLYDSNSLTLIDHAPDHNYYFHFHVHDPCDSLNAPRYKLIPNIYPDDAFKFLNNGSIYMIERNSIIPESDYCFGISDTDMFDVFLCFNSDAQPEDPIIFPIGLFVSVPFLFATFIVYVLIPELKNMHGRTLRGYIASLLIAYVILAIVQISPQNQISDSFCIAFGTCRIYTYILIDSP